jgi:hypothetical protein
MQTLGEVLPALHPKARRWLRSQSVQAAGQPFCKYNVIDMGRQLEIEAGFPVAVPVTGEDPVLTASLPGGLYAPSSHSSSPTSAAPGDLARRRLSLSNRSLLSH